MNMQVTYQHEYLQQKKKKAIDVIMKIIERGRKCAKGFLSMAQMSNGRNNNIGTENGNRAYNN